ncbi:hypothetical protein AB0F96_07370 [Streptomyces sp. NPDC023998]|uniref:hypothetical protein n=1 Tax=Streptomyces sp. NPDC023998 TaxID=3154597 RepID=UPI003402448C
MTTPIADFDDFAALDPFFRIIKEGLAGFVDGRHFFDLLAEDVIFDPAQEKAVAHGPPAATPGSASSSTSSTSWNTCGARHVLPRKR